MMLVNEWQSKTKRWGHPLHSMCSYMGMFPPRLPHYFIQKFTNPGDVVLDPFSGRGTTPLQACVEGRVGIGIDANPMAYVLTAAKVGEIDPIAIRNRVDDLSNDMFFDDIETEPDHIRMLFEDSTLRQLVYLKKTLDLSTPTDMFIAGVLLGMLHGGAKGSGESEPSTGRKSSKPPTFLSVPMPNTFSMSPGYIAKYVAEKKLERPRVDVFVSLRARIDHLLRLGIPSTPGRAWKSKIQDIAKIPDPTLRGKKVRLIFSSPPYLKVLRYGLYNWIRLWFMNEDFEELDRNLDQHNKLGPYLDFLSETNRSLYKVCAPGAVCALVIGDVVKKDKEPILLAHEAWEHMQRRGTRWLFAGILEDILPKNSKVSKIWGEDKKGRATPTDRILVLYKQDYRELRVSW
jgi:hypothetical protein